MVANVEEIAVVHHQRWGDLNPGAAGPMHPEDFVFHMHRAVEPVVRREAIHKVIVVFLRLIPDRRAPALMRLLSFLRSVLGNPSAQG
jgi:hypothetical protein